MSFIKNILYTSAVTSNQIVDTINFYKNELTKNDEKDNKKRIVILGNGWSGKYFHKNLVKHNFDVYVIDKNDYFLETHKMSSKDTQPIIPHEKNYMSKFIKDEVNKIDTKDKKIILKDTFIKYDYLVFGLGSEVNTFNIPGVTENCLFYKSYNDWKKINELHLDGQFVTIIGGGAVGIELAYKIKSKHNCNITVYDAFNILSGFSFITKELVRQDMEKKGIKILENTSVKEFRKNTLQIVDEKKNISYPHFNTAIWTAGIKRHNLLPNKDELEENKENLYVIGDNSTIGPPTAQKAKLEGINLANYFNTNFNEKYNPYKFKFNPFCKIIHTDDGMFVELSKTKTIWLPKFVEPILNFGIDFF